MACGLPCMADSSQHLFRTPGSFKVNDATNPVIVTITNSSTAKTSVSIKWPSGEGATKPLADGWFVYAEDASRVWVFTGEVLSLIHRTDEMVTDESSAKVDKICPKEVRDVLPESYRKVYFP
jgi:hypothetical protein